jgi:alpha-glucosidase
MSEGERRWWQEAVVYQIYPRSFADHDGNGVGDLAGIRSRLDHLEWLGVDALWLSPFFPSPMYDFGYDVADYCDVDPVFGQLEDFDQLLADAHARDIKVMIDWVPAHTSIEHPWFTESRSSQDSPRRDWYVWRDPAADGGLPNNWRAAFKSLPAWTLDETTGQYYLHSFLPEQPDLNWNHPEVVEAMLDTLRFWLDRGVDGFRADVVHNIGKHPDLPSVEGKLAPIPHCALNDEPVTHEHLRRIRMLLDGYPGDRAMVGEVFLLRTEQVAAYYGQDDELHMSFNFPPLFAEWSAEAWRAQVDETRRVLDPVGAWPTWVLSNHDQKRHRTRYGSIERARAAAVLLLTLRGTPFLYMGEELGLEDAVITPDRVVDPGGRDGCRAPIPWTAQAGHGWGDDPWLPFPPRPAEESVESQRLAPDSILHLYRSLLAARRASPALCGGEFAHLPAPEGVLAYRRATAGDEDERVVAINFTQLPQKAALAGDWLIEVASDRAGEGDPYAGELNADQALLLRPAETLRSGQAS